MENKKKILKKLRRNDGASITAALLIFLVCAVTSSVIIAAASTASGRLARMAETDQRYYSVTSAAELLKDIVGGKEVRIVVRKTKNGSGEVSSEASLSEGGATKTIGEEAAGDSFDSIEMLAASQYYRGMIKNGTSDEKASFDLASDVPKASGGKDPLAVSIKESLDSQGNILMEVQSPGANPYTLQLKFIAEVEEFDETDEAGIGEIEYTLSWTFDGIRTVSSNGESGS